MSKVQELVDCPQCAYSEADRLYDCQSFRDALMCPHCGYQEDWKPRCDESGRIYEWKHEIRKGLGVMSYRFPDAIPRPIHFLHTKEELLDAERWLREQLNNGAIATQSAYLTRWNDVTKSVEALVGDLDIFRC